MSLRSLTPAFLMLAAAPAAAQLSPAATPTPQATLPPAASAVPPPIAVTLPTPVATATPPAVRATPTAVPTPAATGTPAPRPTPSSSPTPSATASPEAASTAASTPAPSASPTPVASPTAVAPAVLSDAQPAPALPIPPQRGSAWALPIVGSLLIALGLIAWIVRRRRRRGEPVGEEVEVAATGSDEPVDVVPAAVAATPRAWLGFELRPRRAGLNLLTATLDAAIVVRNEGDAAAEDVRVALHLLSARAGQDAELARLFETPPARPATAPFALAPGEERVVSAMATLSRGEIEVLTVAERPMFVPVAAVAVRYRSGEVEGQTTGAVAIGVERPGAAKLAPFWLDTPARTHDAVGARPHGPTVRR